MIDTSRRRFDWRNPWLVSVVVLLAALALRVGHLSEASQSPLMRDAIPMYDAQYYDQMAREIAAGDWLGDEIFYLAPLYQYVRGVAYAAMPVDDINRVRFIQCVLGAVTCVLICWIAYLLAGPLAGLVAGLIAAFYGVFMYYDGVLMPSALVLGLHMAATLVLLIAARRRSLWLWIASGLLIGLCVVAHGTALLFLLGVLVWIWFGLPDAPVRTRLKRAGAVLVACLLVASVVTVRNYAVGQDFVLLTSNAGKNLYIGNNELASGSFEDVATYEHNDIWGSNLSYYLGNRPRTGRDMRPSEMSAFFVGKARDFAMSQPGKAARLLLRKARLCLNAAELGTNDNFYFARRYSRALRVGFVSFALVAPIGLLGLLWRRGEWRRHLLLILLFGSQFVAFTVTFVLSRYRLTMVAVLIIAAALQLIWWGRELRARRYRSVLFSLLPLALLALLVNVPVAGVARERGFGQQYVQVGKAHLKAGEYELAREAFEKGTTASFEPWYDANLRRAECLILLGRVYERSLQMDEARKQYVRAAAEINSGPVRSPRMMAWLEERLGAGGGAGSVLR
jgi:4-amino-4-deoxy-L-arabinose transferase-like glycosyltransferase